MVNLIMFVRTLVEGNNPVPHVPQLNSAYGGSASSVSTSFDLLGANLMTSMSGPCCGWRFIPRRSGIVNVNNYRENVDTISQMRLLKSNW